ncbi:MAG: FAD binding domain-containing protein [Gemmatimonadaceae bacterium]|nr:FAD binding domain-containing protein [Gemmatimonadaceae bacterium]
MTRFTYLRPSSLAEALEALASPGSVPIGGGTDLLSTVDEGLLAPARVVDLQSLPDWTQITRGADGALRLGAGVAIATLAEHPLVRELVPALALAAASVGSPALRNMGTLGGNLAQRQRCWYLRRGVACFKNGGEQCAAYAGEHSYHAIFDTGPCHAVHPSDPAVALDALDATVEIASARGGAAGTPTRTVSIAALFEGAAHNRAREVTLADDELITAVSIPAAAHGGVQHWEKLIQRAAFDFALVSCAAVRRGDGSVRISLGGVAAGPWRAPLSVEEDVASGGLDADSIDALAERALYDATPLEGTRYKVTMAQAVLRRAMRALGAE